jgi:hypothetical protein
MALRSRQNVCRAFAVHHSEIVAINRRLLILAAALVAIGVPAAVAARLSKDESIRLAGLALNYFATDAPQ